MRTAADIRSHEIKAVWISFFFVLTLMAAYYILRPLRDALSSNWTDAELSRLFTATFLLSVLTTIIYGWACSKIRLSRLLPGIYIAFSISFLVFYGLLQTPTKNPLIEQSFYVWVSVFSLFQVSVFWTFMANTFSQQQAPRLFGFIAAGSSIGALMGPALALFLIAPLGKPNLILLSSLLLLIPVLAIVALEKIKYSELHHKDITSATQKNLPIGGNPFSGFQSFVKDPYLLGIGLFVLLYTVISTFVYFHLKNLLAGLDMATRTQIWSGMDLAVNASSILIAFFVTGRLSTRFGLVWVLALVPVMIVLGSLVMAMAPMLWVVVMMQCVRRAGDYAITKPGREMLFTGVEQEKRFKAKSVIDNVVYRGGDVVAAWSFTGLTQGLGMGLSAIAGIGAIIATFWAGVGAYLGKQYHRRQTACKPEDE